MLSAWYGGLGPGLLATGLGALAVDYFFEHPAYELGISNPDTLATDHESNTRAWLTSFPLGTH